MVGGCGRHRHEAFAFGLKVTICGRIISELVAPDGRCEARRRRLDRGSWIVDCGLWIVDRGSRESNTPSYF